MKRKNYNRIVTLSLFLINANFLIAQNDTNNLKYFEISASYYAEDVLFDRTTQLSKIPVIASPGIIVSTNYYYKQKKYNSDFASLELGYSLHPDHYYKFLIVLLSGSKFISKCVLYGDIIAGFSFHNSWPINTAFKEPVDKFTFVVYDLIGREIYTHEYEGPFTQGEIYWDGNDNDDYPAKTGVYIFQIETNSEYYRGKVMILK